MTWEHLRPGLTVKLMRCHDCGELVDEAVVRWISRTSFDRVLCVENGCFERYAERIKREADSPASS